MAAIEAAFELGALCAELEGEAVRAADDAVCRTLATTASHAEGAPATDEGVVLVKELTEAYMERMRDLIGGCLSRLTTELEHQTGCTTRTGEQ